MDALLDLVLNIHPRLKSVWFPLLRPSRVAAVFTLQCLTFSQTHSVFVIYCFVYKGLNLLQNVLTHHACDSFYHSKTFTWSSSCAVTQRKCVTLSWTARCREGEGTRAPVFWTVVRSQISVRVSSWLSPGLSCYSTNPAATDRKTMKIDLDIGAHIQVSWLFE